ncbi:Thymidylate kinase [hydrothermal vent metagenome]|uniref:Thymidylate kinase n=1 Tax=hydrothermal vent metagenome TaxID=652676 RepID=A0A1W1BM25_9ZZZZ
MPNRLIHEDSPYLKQHANNPVNWWPWCDEAFEKAQKENKPIFISIGYSSCHWCHVMEREVFEDDECAKVLNDHFISIKVDREERPDIDKFYQEVHMLLNRRPGGWPTSIFATPSNKPFFAGTFIPKESRAGSVEGMGFLELTKLIAKKVEEADAKLYENADEIESYIKKISHPKEATVLTEDIYKNFLLQAKNNYDTKYGGFSHKPKFPQASTLLTLIDMDRLYNDKAIRAMVNTTLQNMTKGGIYDLVDGGFCRYSVDEKWLVPHFEKMLYDNALMLKVMVRAYQAYKEPHYRDIALEIASFIEEKMSEDDLFYSASDADSEGEEGSYFVYSYDEVYQALSEAGFEDISRILDRLSITPHGNFEMGKSIVRIEKEKPKEWKRIKAILKDLRADRPYPFIDKKIQTSWNAMYIDALFELGTIQKEYIQKATKSLDKLLKTMFDNKKLYHTTMPNKEPKVEGFLEDFAFLSKALLNGYEKSFDEIYLIKAQHFINLALAEFYDNGVWYFSKGDFQTKAETYDATYTSSVSIMIDNLLTLSSLLSDEKYATFAFKTLEYNSYELSRKPIYYPYMFDMMMRYLKEDRIVKSSQENLSQNLHILAEIGYPYTLLKAEELDEFLICGKMSCFSNVNDAKMVETEIEKSIRK